MFKVNELKKKWALFSSLALMVAVFVLSIVPVPEKVSSEVAPGFLHIFAYFVLTFFLAVAFLRRDQRNAFSKALLAATFYGAFIEGVQHFIPYRHGEWSYVLINAFGAGLSVLPFYVYKRIFFKEA